MKARCARNGTQCRESARDSHAGDVTRSASFHLDNRNIDRRNDANTAEFARTGGGAARQDGTLWVTIQGQVQKNHTLASK